jgi:hypothetical protein
VVGVWIDHNLSHGDFFSIGLPSKSCHRTRPADDNDDDSATGANNRGDPDAVPGLRW